MTTEQNEPVDLSVGGIAAAARTVETLSECKHARELAALVQALCAHVASLAESAELDREYTESRLRQLDPPEWRLAVEQRITEARNRDLLPF